MVKITRLSVALGLSLAVNFGLLGYILLRRYNLNAQHKGNGDAQQAGVETRAHAGESENESCIGRQSGRKMILLRQSGTACTDLNMEDVSAGDCQLVTTPPWDCDPSIAQPRYNPWSFEARFAGDNESYGCLYRVPDRDFIFNFKKTSRARIRDDRRALCYPGSF